MLQRYANGHAICPLCDIACLFVCSWPTIALSAPQSGGFAALPSQDSRNQSIRAPASELLHRRLRCDTASARRNHLRWDPTHRSNTTPVPPSPPDRQTAKPRPGPGPGQQGQQGQHAQCRQSSRRPAIPRQKSAVIPSLSSQAEIKAYSGTARSEARHWGAPVGGRLLRFAQVLADT
jgi:hypothetical protein